MKRSVSFCTLTYVALVLFFMKPACGAARSSMRKTTNPIDQLQNLLGMNLGKDEMVYANLMLEKLRKAPVRKSAMETLKLLKFFMCELQKKKDKTPTADADYWYLRQG